MKIGFSFQWNGISLQACPAIDGLETQVRIPMQILSMGSQCITIWLQMITTKTPKQNTSFYIIPVEKSLKKVGTSSKTVINDAPIVEVDATQPVDIVLAATKAAVSPTLAEHGYQRSET